MNGSVSGLRRAAAIIIATAGIFVSTIIISNTSIERRGPIALQILSTSAALPIIYYIFWLLTPSYNWFALLGGLLLLAAVVDLCDGGHRLRSSAIVAAAMALMIFARPQNALAFALIYLIAVMIFVPVLSNKLKQIVLAGLWSVVFLGAIALFSPIGKIADQIQAYLTIFGTHHPLETSFWDRMFEFFSGPGFLFACSAILFLGSIFTQHGSHFSHQSIKVLLTIAAFVLSVQVVTYSRSAEFIYRVGPTMGSITYLLLALACIKKDANPRFWAHSVWERSCRSLRLSAALTASLSS